MSAGLPVITTTHLTALYRTGYRLSELRGLLAHEDLGCDSRRAVQAVCDALAEAVDLLFLQYAAERGFSNEAQQAMAESDEHRAALGLPSRHRAFPDDALEEPPVYAWARQLGAP